MIGRRILTAVSLISLIALAVVATSWIRSYWVYDQLACGSDHGLRGCRWQAYSAAYNFPGWPPELPEGSSAGVLVCFGKIFFRANRHTDLLPADHSRPFAWASDSNAIPSFSYFYAVTGAMDGRGYWTVRQLSLSHWPLVLLFGAPPVVALRRWRRRTHGPSK